MDRMTNAPDELTALAARIGEALKRRGLMLATAESCTGGWVAQACTAIAGSSDWFERGFVTYSNRAKEEMLGVPADLISKHGAVSEPVVRVMADGALIYSHAEVAVAITGIAGPSGGTPDKPVGTVWFAWARKGSSTYAARQQFSGDREAVRLQSVLQALTGIERVFEAKK